MGGYLCLTNSLFNPVEVSIYVFIYLSLVYECVDKTGRRIFWNYPDIDYF
jgi:hypothetical protein